MSLIVKIFINRVEIDNISARRVDAFKGDDAIHKYVTGNGDFIEHKYSDGARALATKLVDMYWKK